MKRNLRLLVAVSTVVALSATGCSVGRRPGAYISLDESMEVPTDSVEAVGDPPYVPLAELLRHPGRYNRRVICTEGVYLRAFEASALGLSTYDRGGWIYLSKPSIWVSRADIVFKTDCFTQAGIRPATFCKARICGLFKYGSRYGHLGGYAYELGPTGSEP